VNFFVDFDRSTLSIHSDVMAIVRAMSLPDSGLEIRDRMWLKITIPNAFIGMQIIVHTSYAGNVVMSILDSAWRLCGIKYSVFYLLSYTFSCVPCVF
jgi:hypothetical protein